MILLLPTLSQKIDHLFINTIMDFFSISPIVLCFLLLILAFGLWNQYANRKRIEKLTQDLEELNESKNNDSQSNLQSNEHSENQNHANSAKNKEEQLDLNARESNNRECLIKILDKIGSHPTLNEDNNIEFAYQGENFLIILNGAFLRIWDLSWYSIKITDDNFPIIRDAANYANFSFGPVIVMHSPDEQSNVIFSSRLDIPFSSTMYDPEGYLKAILDPFFGIKQSLRKELEHLRDNPQDRTLHENPIGFDTAALTDPTSPQAN